MYNVLYQNDTLPNIEHGENTANYNVFADPETLAQWQKAGWDANGQAADLRLEWNAEAGQLRMEGDIAPLAAPESVELGTDFFGEKRGGDTRLPGPFKQYDGTLRVFRWKR
jgi:hypothetical protein